MKVENALPTVDTFVEDESVACGRQAELLGNATGREHQVAKPWAVLGAGPMDSGDVPPRHDEHVRRRHRPDVAERDGMGVLENDLSGNRLCDDVAEETARHILTPMAL